MKPGSSNCWLGFAKIQTTVENSLWAMSSSNYNPLQIENHDSRQRFKSQNKKRITIIQNNTMKTRKENYFAAERN